MHLRNLSLINFKNYESTEMIFSTKINCIVGDNGVGKSNILDAVYYLSFCKSYFNPIDSQNIRFNQEFFTIQGDYARNEKKENIFCSVKRNTRKVFKRNQKDYERLADHIGLIPLVISSPYDSYLIRGGSEERRKFLDSVISQFNRDYLDKVIHYNKAVSQRNSLLKRFAEKGNFDHNMIEIYDDQLIQLGKSIYQTRKVFIENLLPIFHKYYQYISSSNETAHIAYKSDLHESDMATLLKTSLPRDRMLQYTSSGIHKDDLLFEIHGYPLKKTGSQGQQKSFLIALKLAQFEFIKGINNFNPILLLDDIFDKLDSKRVTQIVKLVSENNFGQIFITDTNKQRVDNILKEFDIDYKIITIEGNE